MSRKRYEWKLAQKTLQLGDRTLIVGVLNVTPDSFSDGGHYADPDRAFARAIEMEEEGVDIIDIGAESTRPGATRISEAEELRRLIPVLKRLKGKLMVPVSVDTYKAEVARKAIEYGAEIINDPSGLTFDPELAKVAANANAGLILNHMRGTPDTWAKLPPLKDVAGTIFAELDAAIHRAQRGGIDPKRIVVDPGIGFGKRREQNSEIIARLAEFARLDRPILVGPSRKQFLAQETPEAKEFGTAAAVAAAIMNGAHLVRVHDVKSMTAVIQVADAIVAARPQPREEEERPAERRRPAAGPAPAREGSRPPSLRPAAGMARGGENQPLRPAVPTSRPADQRPPRESSEPPRRQGGARPFSQAGPRPAAPSFGRSGPPSRQSSGPRRDDGEGRPPRQDDRDLPSRGGPPRRDASAPPYRGSGPPRKFFGPPRREDRGGGPSGGPPRRESKPPYRGSGPPRKSSGPPRREDAGSRPPSREDDRGRPSRGGPPRRGAPASPYRGSGPPSRKPSGPPAERPPRGDGRAGPSRGPGDRPPRRKSTGRPPRRDDRDRPPRRPSR